MLQGPRASMAGKSYHWDKVTGEVLNERVILNESLAGNTDCFLKSQKSKGIKSNFYNFGGSTSFV